MKLQMIVGVVESWGFHFTGNLKFPPRKNLGFLFRHETWGFQQHEMGARVRADLEMADFVDVVEDGNNLEWGSVPLPYQSCHRTSPCNNHHTARFYQLSYSTLPLPVCTLSVIQHLSYHHPFFLYHPYYHTTCMLQPPH
jgi:hypothetical protein